MTMMAPAVAADSCFGDDQAWPPGFRFHPTDEELVLYYLKRKICGRKLKFDVIRETNVYKWDPEELPAQSKLKTGDRQWFFFCPRNGKYPNRARSSRATGHGYWKATGKDRNITSNSRTVGVKKTLVFYRGHAPNGKRTDWVMHEYTLDEEELKRCQNVKDCYALYKVFKKSGPGPQNGEQYGAPFKEEEWADEEYASNPVDTIIPVKPSNEAIPDDNVKASGQVQSPLNDVEEFMRQVADGPALPQPQANFGYILPQVAGEEEVQSALLEPSPRDLLCPEPLGVLHDQPSFDFSPSPTSQLQLHEVPELASVADHTGQLSQICKEGFLEIDDLISPEPVTFTIENTVENGQFNEFDGQSEFDLYYDAAMFLQDLGPIDQATVPFSYDNMINQVSYHLESQSDISLMDQQVQPQSHISLMDHHMQHQSNINLMDQQLQPQLNFIGDNQQLQSQLNAVTDNQHLQPQMNAFEDNMSNQVDYQLQFESDGNELDQQLQMDKVSGSFQLHGGDVFLPSGSNHGNASPTSGLVYDPVNPDHGDRDSGGGSRFSSALWSFVESIPTTPASASESPLVNHAFERMSSFSRLRLNARKTDNSAVIGAATARTGLNTGFFFISILGALCAILCFLIGTVRVLGRSISS